MHLDDSNPYARTPSMVKNADDGCKLRLTKRWMMTGFVLASLIPVALGAYRLHHESVYYVSLLPGEAACGMGSLGALLIMIVGVPIFGLIGGTVGWAASQIRF